MAILTPEEWVPGFDNKDLRPTPGRKTLNMFTGSTLKFPSEMQGGGACRVFDIVTSDYITSYWDGRINGHNTTSGTYNQDGRDGWGASAWGVFQDVHITDRVYQMGRHRSTALRVFDEYQYSTNVYASGTLDASHSANIGPGGSGMLKTSELISKAKDRWCEDVLNVDMDKYILFTILSGHMRGRLIGKDQATEDRVFTGNAQDYRWVAQPDQFQGIDMPPAFAPIHGIQWDDENVITMLQNIKVTWNELNIPDNNRVIYMDPFYELRLMRALTGSGIPATDLAYQTIENGEFKKLMGWEFDFTIPSNYWPSLYFDNNLNVCHGFMDGNTYKSITADNFINSVAGSGGDSSLLEELVEANRMGKVNWVRTYWDGTKFKKVLTNYPLGNPWSDDYYGAKAVTLADDAKTTVDAMFGTYEPNAWPYEGRGVGIGLPPSTSNKTDKATGPAGTPTLQKVIGLALYRPSGQVSQEYSEMRTDDGKTRAKCTELVFDVKYDGWAIEQLACGIIPIIQGNSGQPVYGLPVSVASEITSVQVPVSAKIEGSIDEGYSVTQIAWRPSAPANPTVTYAWYKKVGATESSLNKTTAQLSSSNIPSASSTDDTLVYCKVTSGGVTVTTNSFTVPKGQK